jgi:hypothetical protein
VVAAFFLIRRHVDAVAEQYWTQGLDAPGARELEKLGCRPAVVLDLVAFTGAIAKGAGNITASTVASGKTGRYLVKCFADPESAPSCDDVKAEYLRAVPHPDGGEAGFLVAVTRLSAPNSLRASGKRWNVEVFGGAAPSDSRGRPPNLCMKLYDANGAFVRDMDGLFVRNTPDAGRSKGLSRPTPGA